jgi:two-component system alkaline phosphatase synthesis response regulator PhoP
MKNTIAIVEDDQEIAHIEKLTLEKEGYACLLFAKGEDFLNQLPTLHLGLVILDLMLPDLDGLTLLKRIRNLPSCDAIDVIIVSAKGLVSDKVEGLDLGADDYLEKPFSTLELASRVNARFRKHHNESTCLTFPGFSFDEKAHILSTSDGKEVPLTKSEWVLLAFFLHHPNEAIPRSTLFNALWGEGDYESRALDVHLFSLRKKLQDTSGKLLETVYGIGYRFNL